MALAGRWGRKWLGVILFHDREASSQVEEKRRGEGGGRE